MPVFMGGEQYEERNLQPLCRDCHIRKTRIERGVSPSYVVHSQEWELLLQQLV